MKGEKLYYLCNEVVEGQIESAKELKDTVEKLDDEATFAVQSESDEEQKYKVEMRERHRSELPDQQIDKCKHILAVELAHKPDAYFNSLYNEDPEEPKMALVGYCNCPGFSMHDREPIMENKRLNKEPEVVDEKEEESTALEKTKQETGQLTDLVAGISQIKERYDKFEQLKTALLTKSDMQSTGKSSFVKKSGWRKIATAFGLSLEKLEEERYKENGFKVVEVGYQAIAPNGQHQDATAKCSFGEENIQGRLAAAKSKAENIDDKDKADRKVEGAKAKLVHDVAATAETRAKNRAISDLVGGGEVSYEEVSS